jgi:hypothetical protein
VVNVVDLPRLYPRARRRPRDHELEVAVLTDSLVTARTPAVRSNIRSGALGGEFLGEVTEIGITYVALSMSDGPEHLPNSQVLAAVVRPQPPA